MLASELAALFARDITRLIQELQAFPDTAIGVEDRARCQPTPRERWRCTSKATCAISSVPARTDRIRAAAAARVQRARRRAAELIARLEAVKAMIPRVIAGLSDPSSTRRIRNRASTSR